MSKACCMSGCSDGNEECGDSDGWKQGGPHGQERSSSTDSYQSKFTVTEYLQLCI